MTTLDSLRRQLRLMPPDLPHEPDKDVRGNRRGNVCGVETHKITSRDIERKGLTCSPSRILETRCCTYSRERLGTGEAVVTSPYDKEA